MNQPWICMCSLSQSPLPPPSPSHPSGSSQCTTPEHLSHASVGEGEGGMFRKNSIETSILSRVKQILVLSLHKSPFPSSVPLCLLLMMAISFIFTFQNPAVCQGPAWVSYPSWWCPKPLSVVTFLHSCAPVWKGILYLCFITWPSTLSRAY